jgi:hypothetical protein
MRTGKQSKHSTSRPSRFLHKVRASKHQPQTRRGRFHLSTSRKHEPVLSWPMSQSFLLTLPDEVQPSTGVKGRLSARTAADDEAGKVSGLGAHLVNLLSTHAVALSNWWPGRDDPALLACVCGRASHRRGAPEDLQ